MITGTIKNTVHLAMMDMKWQQKKQDLHLGKEKKEMTGEERQIQAFQDQIKDMNENKGAADIDAKLQSGQKLTPEEIEYLRKHNPQALKEYEQLQQERKSYERQLRRCKTKEEVEKLQINKMGECLSKMKKIANNPNIPKGEKLAELKKIMYQAAGINAEHREFLKTAEYASLPEDEKERKRRKGEHSEKVEPEDEQTDSLELPTDQSKEADEIRKKIKALASDQGIAVEPEQETAEENVQGESRKDSSEVHVDIKL